MFGRSGAHGLVDINDQTITVQLFDGEGKSLKRTIDRATWKET